MHYYWAKKKWFLDSILNYLSISFVLFVNNAVDLKSDIDYTTVSSFAIILDAKNDFDIKNDLDLATAEAFACNDLEIPTYYVELNDLELSQILEFDLNDVTYKKANVKLPYLEGLFVASFTTEDIKIKKIDFHVLAYAYTIILYSFDAIEVPKIKVDLNDIDLDYVTNFAFDLQATPFYDLITDFDSAIVSGFAFDLDTRDTFKINISIASFLDVIELELENIDVLKTDVSNNVTLLHKLLFKDLNGLIFSDLTNLTFEDLKYVENLNN